MNQFNFFRQIRQEVQFLGQIERFVTHDLQLRFLVLCYVRLSTAVGSRLQGATPNTPGGPSVTPHPLPLDPTFVVELVRRMTPAMLSKATYLLIEYVVMENLVMEVNADIVRKNQGFFFHFQEIFNCSFFSPLSAHSP